MIPLLNPYEELFLELSTAQGCDLARIRKRLVAAYAFAIPNREALTALAAEAPLVELGAGAGYWAFLLRQLGVKIEAFDRNSQAPPLWSRVDEGTPETVLQRDPRGAAQAAALFLCWPPLVAPVGEPPSTPRDSLAAQALQLYQGATVCFVGEWRGRTGCPDFFDELEAGWQLTKTVAIPQWPGFRDALQIWKRG
jgi:hypothetical protein